MRSLLVIALCACRGQATHPPPTDKPPPRVAAAATSIVPRGSLASSWHDTCAIEATGKVACWGLGGAGRTGTPDELDHVTPIEVPGLDAVSGLAGGTEFMCAWTARGEVFCWGGDARDNRAADHHPRVVPHVANIVQVVAGLFGACGLQANGRVVCWPQAAWTDPLWPPPEDVAGLDGVVEIAGDDSHLCARLTSGDVTSKYAPDNHHEARFTVVPELAGATSLAGADEKFAALLPGARLASWDIADFEGRRGEGRTKLHWVDGIAGERVVVGQSHEVCVLGATARCWNQRDLDPPKSDVVALARPLPAGVRDLGLGHDASCARIGDGARCWGMYGRLGDGIGEWPTEFAKVKEVSEARQLAANTSYMCALHRGGRIACWGGRPAVHTPYVMDYEPVELPHVTDAVEIAMSHDLVCAIRKAGVTCWSFARDGGAIAERAAPELASAVTLYAGPDMCAALANGTIACTSRDSNSRHPKHPAQPLHAAAASSVDPVSTLEADYARSPDGTLTATEHRTRNQLTQAVAASPVPEVATLTGVVEQRASEYVGCARRSDGTVACWGNRDYLGAGQRAVRTDPVAVANLEMGAPRPFTPPAPERPTIARSTGAPIRVTRRSMMGPYKTSKAACEAQACPDHEHEKYCADLAGQYDAQEVMAAPPAPFSEVRLIAFDCRNPDNQPDSLRRLRLMVTRPDGVWLSAPLVVAGVNGQAERCDAIEAARWATRAVATQQNVVLSLVAGVHCRGDEGGDDDELAAIIVAGNAAKPFTFAPVVTAVSQAHGCTPSAQDCTPSDRTLRLAITFTGDGLVLEGDANWPAIRRDHNGAIEGLVRGKTEAAATGTFSFTAP